MRTLHWHSHVPQLRVSARYPQVDEIVQNIKAMFGDHFAPGLQKPLGHVLMVDELAVECRLCYDPENDTILGLCQEHSKDYNLKFESHDEAHLVLEGIHSDKLHFSSEVSVSLVLLFDFTDIKHDCRQPSLRWALSQQNHGFTWHNQSLFQGCVNGKMPNSTPVCSKLLYMLAIPNWRQLKAIYIASLLMASQNVALHLHLLHLYGLCPSLHRSFPSSIISLFSIHSVERMTLIWTRTTSTSSSSSGIH
jgi:hypothetical protein